MTCDRSSSDSTSHDLLPLRTPTDNQFVVAEMIMVTHLIICSDFINWAWPFVKRGEMATRSSKVASPNTELGEDDLGALYVALYPARNSYKSIGLLIGVKIENIESNKADSGDRLLAVLSVRLNKAEPLTWNEIDSALRSECVDKSRLADKLRQKYGHFIIPESSTESESEKEHEIKSEEIKRVKRGLLKSKKEVITEQGTREKFRR